MTKDEALKLALDALEGFIPYLPLKDKTQCNRYDKAITALRLAIDVENMASKSTYKEQLETKDEPVGWIDSKGYMICVKTDESCRPLYTTPQRTWVGLTDEDIQKLAAEHHDWESLYLAVQAKLKEKNT